MEKLDSTILESFEAGGCGASFHMDGSHNMCVLVRDKYGDIVAQGTGNSKNHALTDAHDNWKAPAKPKAKPATKKKSVRKTAPIEEDAQDA